MAKTKSGISERELRISQSDEVKSLESQLTEMESKFGEYRKDHGKLSMLMENVLSAVQAAEPVDVEPFLTDAKGRVDSPCAAIAQFTDVHYGAVQDKSEVEGFGEYNPEISERRLGDFTGQFLKWISNKSKYDFDECVLILTGDNVSGDIHQELQVTNAFPVPVQAVGVANLFSKQILKIAGCFKKVRVEMIGEDNHGRLAIKPQCKEAGLNNWNYVIQDIIRKTISNQKNVEFNFYPQYEAVIKVKNRQYLICHGHNVQGWMGFPYYGIERKVSKEAIKRLWAPDGTKFHRVILGHWHTELAHPQFWIGKSLQGTDAYDHKAGRFSSPGQSTWCVHPQKGEFDRTDFTVD